MYKTDMIYGRGGCGKTWYCRSAADHFGWQRTLWLHTERPIVSFDYHLWTTAEPWGVRYLPDATIDDIIKVVQPLRLAARGHKWQYDLVVLDGITETDLSNFSKIEETSGAKDGRQMWGEQADDMLRLFWALRAGGGTHAVYPLRLIIVNRLPVFAFDS